MAIGRHPVRIIQSGSLMRHFSSTQRPLCAVATLIVLVAACDNTAPRGPGSITVTSSAQVLEPSFFEYGVSIDSGTPRMVIVGDILSFTARGLAHGTHSVTTTALPTTCTGGQRRDVDLRGDDTAVVTISIQCARTTGDIGVSVSTTGSSLDPNGYYVIVDQAVAGILPSNGSTVIRYVPPGGHGVALANVQGNCTASPAQTITVGVGAMTNVVFTVTCAPTATLQFIASQSGSERDPDGVTVRLDGGAASRNPMSGSRSVTVTAGTHSYVIGDIAPNCSLGGPASGTVTLGQGETATITTTLTCAAAPIGTVGVVAADAAADTLSNASRNPAAAHDIRAVSARYDAGWIILVLRFARPPGSSYNSAPGLHGAIDLDTDEKVATGITPLINAFGGSASQGSDYSIDFFDTDSISAAIYSNLANEDLGRVRTKHEGDSVIVHIPLEKLGNDDGNMTVTMVLGTADRPTDIAPNSAVITARIPAGMIVDARSGSLRATTSADAPSASGRPRPRRPAGKWKMTR